MQSTEDERQPTNHSCFSRVSLREYLAGLSDEQSAAAIETHLTVCSHCDATLAELERESEAPLTKLRRTSEKLDSVIEQAMESARKLHLQTTSKSLSPAMLPNPLPQRVGPYELIEPLGRGGMGSVYLARHVRLNREVAIKVLPTQFVRPDIQARFEREILAAGALKHSGIVMATDAGQSDALLYLVMEYVRGLDLGRIARAVDEIAIAEVCEIGRQIAMGLSSAHAAGMVHRDIKPSNVMLDESGTVKLLDFGLVLFDRWDGVTSELTTVGQFLGTLDYMSPEQADRCGTVDYRADLYSLGATLFRLLTGRAPLAASPNQSPLEKLQLLARHHPPSLNTLRGDAPETLVQLIDSLLATQPIDRPASAAHVAELLMPLAADADLIGLLSKAQKNSAATVDDSEKRSLMPSTRQRIASKKSVGNSPPRNYRRWLAAAALPLVAFAGFFLIVLETNKGQLVIDSDVPASIKITRDGKRVQEWVIQPGNTTTRLAADEYAITIDSPWDEIKIDQDRFVLQQGQTIIARIQRNTASPTKAKSSEPVFEGLTYDAWFQRLKTERATKLVQLQNPEWLDIYFCHLWANELRATPTLDSKN